jgi:hypothetical protein
LGFWGFIRCLAFPHAINRRKVRSEGERYSGYCNFCNAPLRRIKRDQWVRDWRATFGLSPAPIPEDPEIKEPSKSKKRRRRS